MKSRLPTWRPVQAEPGYGLGQRLQVNVAEIQQSMHHGVRYSFPTMGKCLWLSVSVFFSFFLGQLICLECNGTHRSQAKLAFELCTFEGGISIVNATFILLNKIFK